jgi:hypothetical protein
MSGELHVPMALPPGEISCTHWIGGSMAPPPRAGLDDMEKYKFFTLPGLELIDTIEKNTQT